MWKFAIGWLMPSVLSIMAKQAKGIAPLVVKEAELRSTDALVMYWRGLLNSTNLHNGWHPPGPEGMEVHRPADDSKGWAQSGLQTGWYIQRLKLVAGYWVN